MIGHCYLCYILYRIIIDCKSYDLQSYILSNTSLIDYSYNVIIYNQQTIRTGVTLNSADIVSYKFTPETYDGYGIIGIFVKTTENYITTGICCTDTGEWYISIFNHYNSALTFDVYATTLYKKNGK